MTFEISKTTDLIIHRLYGAGNQDKASLAALRGAMSLSSPRAQKAWPVLIDNLDEKMLSRNGQPTYAEIAIFTAVHFYAIHQMSEANCVYGRYSKDATDDSGVPLFRALNTLRQNEGTKEALDRRVQALLGTTNVDSVIHGAAQLVRILKSNKKLQKVDYAQLAQDLYWFQMSYEQANRIRLKWGQQYFWTKTKKTVTEGEKN